MDACSRRGDLLSLMEANTISFGAAFIAGIAGSTHCIATCGGRAGALRMRALALAPNPAAAFFNAATYQFGRIFGYAIVGLIFGFAGATLQSTFDLMRIGAVLRIASGVVLI